MNHQQTATLAQQFAVVNQAVIDFVMNCTATTWQTVPPGEKRTVGVIAHHIATSHHPIVMLAGLIAEGQPIPEFTQESLNHSNADHAAHFANCTQAEVIDLLEKNGRAAQEFIHKLDQAALARRVHIPAFNATMNAAEVIEQVLIGHTAGHLATLRS